MSHPIAHFTSSAETVIAIINAGPPIAESIYTFSLDVPGQDTARLLAANLTNAIGARLLEARVAAYNQGYADGRNHKPKAF